MKKILAGIVALAAVFIGGFAMTANATGTDPVDCSQPTITVVVTEAYDEVIPATPDLWWNWSPNHQQGPFDGPPDFPVDARGTWEGPHENGGPSQDTYGTFQQGNGNGSWFHREHGTEEQVIHHDAVTQEVPNPDYPCETETPTEPPTDTPTTDVPTETPTVPTETPTVTVPTDEPTVPTETPTVPNDDNPFGPDGPFAPTTPEVKPHGNPPANEVTVPTSVDAGL